MKRMDPLAYEMHRGALFGLCYRMTGSASDAEDMVQETFRKALERPPADQDAPLRPWLMKVASNLCIDALRKRKSERYFGPWLPEPVESTRLTEGLEPSPEARYGALESASVAFLLALSVLEPRPRAVLVLRDVLGLSGEETAEILALSPGNARVVLHRARKTLASAEVPARIDEATRARAAEALRRFLSAMAAGDPASVVDLLAEDVVSVHDGGGEVNAAVRVVRGREKVLALYTNLARSTPPPIWIAERDYNGAPALAVELPEQPGRYPRRAVFQVELDARGRVSHLRVIIAPSKLRGLVWPEDQSR